MTTLMIFLTICCLSWLLIGYPISILARRFSSQRKFDQDALSEIDLGHRRR